MRSRERPGVAKSYETNGYEAAAPLTNLPSRTHPWGNNAASLESQAIYGSHAHTSWPSNPHPPPGTTRTTHFLWVIQTMFKPYPFWRNLGQLQPLLKLK